LLIEVVMKIKLAVVCTCIALSACGPEAEDTSSSATHFLPPTAPAFMKEMATIAPASTPGPAVTLTPSTLDLGSVDVGSSSTIQLITVKNSGTSSITLGTKLQAGDFAYGDIGTCTDTLAAGASCTWSIKLDPTASGTRTATLTQTDSAPGSPRVVALTGIGLAAQMSPPSTPPTMESPLAFPCGSGCDAFYVSPSGSDSNAGSQAAPWKTLTHAVATAAIGSAGTVIHAAAGTYPGSIDIHRGGTSASARLVIRCDAAWSVPSASGCLVRSGHGFMVWGGNYIDIQGFDVSNADAEAAIDIVYSGSAVQSATGNHVRVLSNYVHDLGQNTHGNAQNATLVGCPSGSAIQGQTSHGHVIVDAEVIGNRVEHIGTKSPACNQYHGIYMDGIDAIVENNLVIDTAAYGIHVYDAACGHRVSNNVVVRPGQGGILFKGSNGCTAGMNTAINNIVVNAVRAGFDYLGDCDGGGASLFANNLVFGNGGGDFAWAPGSSSSCDSVQGTLHEDPATTFVDYASGDFHLKAGSIAIGHGTAACAPGQSSCVPTEDFDGVARPAGGPIDIGAFEHL
jgi:parallel beta-helix repeat protein